MNHEVTNDELLAEVIFGRNNLLLDERGGFRRLLDIAQLREMLNENTKESFEVQQSNYSFNEVEGTWRGFHAQLPPYAETKIITCISGKILDVYIDVRPDSPTYLVSGQKILDSRAGDYIILPKGFAHGYLTLEDNSAIVYFVDTAYSAKNEIGFNVSDPRFDFDFKECIRVISNKDNSWPFIESSSL